MCCGIHQVATIALSLSCIGHQVHIRRKSTLFAMFTGDWNFDNDNTSGSKYGDR